MSVRTADITRTTRETHITLSLALDGSGQVLADTGVGFLDHMLTHVGHHGLFDLSVCARGDVHVDFHHTVEDIGIALGQALAQAVGDKAGIERFGSSFVPMDESLVHVALDLSGRPHLEWGMDLPKAKVGEFDVELAQEFFRALAANCGANIHVRCLAGTNLHHMLEAAFKALGRALRDAVSINARVQGIPSTKGTL